MTPADWSRVATYPSEFMDTTFFHRLNERERVRRRELREQIAREQMEVRQLSAQRRELVG